jgi:predicted component of type VI protein secretion system
MMGIGLMNTTSSAFKRNATCAYYSGVTEVLQRSYSGVTVVLQWCYSGVTVVSQWCQSGVTVPSITEASMMKVRE